MSGEANCPKCGRNLSLMCWVCEDAENKEADDADHARDVKIRKDVDAAMRAAIGECWNHLWGPGLEQLGHIIDLDRRRAVKAEAALLAIEHAVDTVVDGGDAAGEVLALVEKVLGKPGDPRRNAS